MTDNERRRALLRVADAQIARRAEFGAELAAAPRPAASGDGSHVVGARVFDTVTGQEGEVLGGARENIIVPGRE